MARTEIEEIVVPSILDRLTDLDPRATVDPGMTREASELAFKRAVERDVELLLNTRRTMIAAPEDCPELRHSVYEFGLIDATGVAVATKAGRERLLDGLRDALIRYEPRLANVRVRLVDADQVRAPQMRFVVEAMLRVGRERHQVVFDTVLEVSRGEYDVKTADEGAAS
ncbi:MAG TPA: type VI secretion system baseplate subunit TssE [Gemmatimonadaceae bacterium]|nr:type VI secretion system baseplate subunit TssE [Gemmatimonadaceae bacterium]